ncbi:helix-turn-helix domain-containing protein [Thalassococcus sp. CAU 1522]|uniref:Helix-turn-helix domain-containing protein n=1 Tax=Thalassococcus arenae TaxID=2851652 RepID=A0ABS6N7H8_9RHOB|nr:helix-turn-helix transcriptional regulator [Thalassococcus arenae]MBV2359958.1 helix-turn-helix domain-containing protein [Thalassococcus arenae]
MSQIDFLLGRSIARKRVSCGISQGDLAIRTGISKHDIAGFEAGTARATASQLFGIARALDIRIETLFRDIAAAAQTGARDEGRSGWRDANDVEDDYHALPLDYRSAVFEFLIASGKERADTAKGSADAEEDRQP